MAAVEKSREQQLVDEHVLQDAVETVMHNVGNEYFDDLFLSACGDVCWEDLLAELGMSRWSQLYGEAENAEDVPGYWQASSRSCALAAALLARLASDDVQQYMIRESARLAALSSEHARMGPISEGRDA